MSDASPPPEPLSRAERQVRYEYHRRRNLPDQLERARLKVRHLEIEAKRYGMDELLDPARQA